MKRSLAAVFMVTAVVFLPCLWNVLQWDDLQLLSQKSLSAPLPQALWFCWTNTLLGHYTPLTWMSWLADLRLGGGAPWVFHLVNILLHGANAVLAALLARRVLRRAAPAVDEVSLTAGVVGAALFFSLHPLRVETVAWATERRGLLSAFFGMAAALLHERCVEGKAPLWPAPALLAAAVLSKETAVMWAPVLTCWRWMGGRSTVRELWSLAFLWVVGVAGGLAGLAAVHHQGIAMPWTEYGPHVRLAQSLRSPLWAAAKTLWPSGLSPLYEISGGGQVPLVRWGAAAVGGGLTAAALAFLRPAPSLAWVWVVPCLFLAPTAGLFQSGPQEAADRYTYVACLPWAFLWGAVAARAAALARGGRAGGVALSLALALWIGALAGLSVRQQGFWRTPFSLWERVLEVSPGSAYGHYALGVEQGRVGAWDDALASFRRALALSPAFPRALYGAGAALQKVGRPERALVFFRLAEALDPNDELVRRIPGLLRAGAGGGA